MFRLKTSFSTSSVKTVFFLLILAVFLFFVCPAQAIEYQVVYNAQYYPDFEKSAKVNLTIKIVNLRSDVYVKEFSLLFPEEFSIENLTASDDSGKIEPEIERQQSGIRVNLTFSSPRVGKDSQNTFHLQYSQDNLFTAQGNIWEVILPTVKNKTNSIFNVAVHLPEKTDKKISIAKPFPSKVEGKSIYWDNVEKDTIYAVFGDSQLYQLKLVYNLSNEKVGSVYFDLAFPPETLYQKVLVSSIDPRPTKVFIDDDGNYIGRFIVGGKEEKKILFEGFVRVFPRPQEDMISLTAENFSRQKKYLLTGKTFLQLGDKVNDQEIKDLKSAQDIYRFVTNKLNYNYKRLNKDIRRMGAQQALEKPDLAVCMEFTDLFVALAREKGIYAREINGYGFSKDPKIRPLSLVTDVLHSWPEYYDLEKKLWIPIDPTWEDTSGIDYFSSFDLNHIVFAIHGKDSTLPLPAGLYKTEDSKDLVVLPVKTLPKEERRFNIEEDFKAKIVDVGKYKAEIELTNLGNVFVKDAVLEIESPALDISPKRIEIDLLAPYQTIDLALSYKAKENLSATHSTEMVEFRLSKRPFFSKKIEVYSLSYDLLHKGLGVGAGFFILASLYLLLRRKNKLSI